MNVLRWLLSTQLKPSENQNANGGFTLIELLAALILAFLVITPLLGFMISVLDTDRKEQAKANSEQELKAAADYISRDLQQALYIYDDEGLNGGVKNLNPIKNQIPSVTNGYPVLVFWKREFAPKSVNVDVPDSNNDTNDSFVYSLVAYYLISDGGNSTWSKAARIARFQIKDGIKDTSGQTCPNVVPTTTDKYSLCPDKGFKALNLSQTGKTLTEVMNSWTNSSSGSFDKSPVVLVDFIDQTTIAQGAPQTTTCSTDLTKVPATVVISSFYVCVDSTGVDNRSVAEIYLRGNAQARLNSDTTKISYNPNQSSYFPSANIKVQGRSFINPK